MRGRPCFMSMGCSLALILTVGSAIGLLELGPRPPVSVSASLAHGGLSSRSWPQIESIGDPPMVGSTRRISVASDGSQADDDSGYVYTCCSPLYQGGAVSMSVDGRYVAFDSSAINLMPGVTIGKTDVFLRDRATGQTTRASLASGGMRLCLWACGLCYHHVHEMCDDVAWSVGDGQNPDPAY